MELKINKDINPHLFNIAKLYTAGDRVVFGLNYNGEPASFEDYAALLGMARAAYNFMNKQGSFSEADDLEDVNI